MTRRRRRVPPPGASPSHSESPGHQDGKGRGVTSPKAAGASAPVFKSFAQPPHKFHLEKGRVVAHITLHRIDPKLMQLEVTERNLELIIAKGRRQFYLKKDYPRNVTVDPSEGAIESSYKYGILRVSMPIVDDDGDDLKQPAKRKREEPQSRGSNGGASSKTNKAKRKGAISEKEKMAALAVEALEDIPPQKRRKNEASFPAGKKKFVDKPKALRIAMQVAEEEESRVKAQRKKELETQEWQEKKAALRQIRQERKADVKQKRYDEAMDAVLQRRDRTRSKSQLRALKAAQFAMAFSDDDDDESSKQDSPKGHITIEDRKEDVLERGDTLTLPKPPSTPTRELSLDKLLSQTPTRSVLKKTPTPKRGRKKRVSICLKKNEITPIPSRTASKRTLRRMAMDQFLRE